MRMIHSPESCTIYHWYMIDSIWIFKDFGDCFGMWELAKKVGNSIFFFTRKLNEDDDIYGA